MAAQPSLSQLDVFIAKVRSYPISAGQLLNLAHEIKAPREIISFYKRFTPDRIFQNQEELANSSEQVELLREEERQMPKEELVATEEY